MNLTKPLAIFKWAVLLLRRRRCAHGVTATDRRAAASLLAPCGARARGPSIICSSAGSSQQSLSLPSAAAPFHPRNEYIRVRTAYMQQSRAQSSSRALPRARWSQASATPRGGRRNRCRWQLARRSGAHVLAGRPVAAEREQQQRGRGRGRGRRP